MTLDVFRAPFDARLRLPKDTPLVIKGIEPPGGIVSRMAFKSAVISRASNSMNPDPCIATLADERYREQIGSSVDLSTAQVALAEASASESTGCSTPAQPFWS